MNEYIERKSLEIVLNNWRNFLMQAYGKDDHYTSGFDEAVKIVKNFKTADVAQVVRCKDCRMATKDIMIDGWYHCENNLMTHRPDCFCSYGDKRDEKE